MRKIVGCFGLPKAKSSSRLQEFEILASETAFKVNEVEALDELFQQLSSSLINDGRIHKEEFLLALFNCSSKKNLLAEKLFELFDIKHDGVIAFEEFVRSLSIFHPDTPKADKIAFAFKLYDIGSTGYIERDELKSMVLATLSEGSLSLSDEDVEAMIDRTLQQSNLKKEGKIDFEEWQHLVAEYPSLIKNMTVPHLREVTLVFSRFVMETEVSDAQLVS